MHWYDVPVFPQESEVALSVNAWTPHTPGAHPPRHLQYTALPHTHTRSEHCLAVSPQDDDMYDRATEAICRFAVASMLHALHTTRPCTDSEDSDFSCGDIGPLGVQHGWVNPSPMAIQPDEEDGETHALVAQEAADLEELLDHRTNIEYVLVTIRDIMEAERAERGIVGGGCVSDKEMFQKLIGALLHPQSLSRSLQAVLNMGTRPQRPAAAAPANEMPIHSPRDGQKANDI